MYSKCNEPLGMENGVVPDDHVTALSVWSEEHGMGNARLHFKSKTDRAESWSAKNANENQWLQVDLGSLVVITQIATQGRQDHRQWVESYTISYSLDGDNFHTYENGKVLNRIGIH